ncbi:MAG TPA: DNA polymerase III subunit delta [Dehalococcoidia bacterium]
MPPPARVYLFHGPDAFSARESLRALRSDLGVGDNNVVRLDGASVTLTDIAAAAQSASFFAEPRLVIIEGLATKFGGRRGGGGRSRAGRGRQAAAPASDLDQLVELLSNLPETTTVALLEDEPSPGFLDALKPVATTKAFAVKRGDELRRWAEARTQERGAAISGQALGRLCDVIDGFHIGELAQEIDKLVAYTDGRRIELADVEELVSGAIEYQNWDLTDAVMAGRPDQALRLLQRMDEKRHPPQLLHSLIVRQYRQVLTAQAMLREGFAAPQIGERLGITHSYPLGKVIDQASRYPADGLDKAYRRLLESDAAIKTGLMDIDTALDLLIVDLAEIGNAGRRGARPAGAR